MAHRAGEDGMTERNGIGIDRGTGTASWADSEWGTRQGAAWLRASEHATRSMVEAQRAAFSMFGLIDDDDASDEPTTGPADSTDSPDRAAVDSEHAGDDADEPAGGSGDPEWEWDRTVDRRTELSVGDRVRFSKQLTDDDIVAFAGASGDTNRLHLEDEFAEETRFGGRIVHGTLVSGLISAALARLPGLTIYLSQDVRFLRPVSPGTTLTAVVEVLEVLGDDRYRLSTVVQDEEGQAVIEGEAVVLVDERPTDGPSVLEQNPVRE